MKRRFIAEQLDSEYQNRCCDKWKKVLDIPGYEIADEYVRTATAVVLENSEKELLGESYSSGIGAQDGTGDGGGALGSVYNMQNTTTDTRIPSVIIPTVRRVFPTLLAHEVCGVQPMNAPIGFAFAFRALYGLNGQFKTGSGSQYASAGTEIGYNQLDSTFTGASGNLGTGDYWEAYAGTSQPGGLYDNQVWHSGQGAELADSEWAKIGVDMPTVKYKVEKTAVVAKTRKLAANWSLELAEDMKKMHGIDADSEMVNIISYELNAEIDRQLITEMVMAAGTAGHVSTWSPVSADGRNQMERLATLYTHVLDKSQDVAVRTRRGAANFAITSPKVCGLLQRMGDFELWGKGTKVDVSNIGVAKVGTMLQGGMKVYRDVMAGGNYILLGYKGNNPYDSGIIYCPYIPIQLMRAIGPDDFSPRIGARTRYGILNHLFGAGLYYHMIIVNGLTSQVVADGSGRVFMY